ncbi:VCBS repeat-containing protein [uncultured Tateyamaria sp.]|uniref:FG-GAP repeat domain-containing protein n=1 Tax=uncultured Tateyamaria sp. TaxID=455651 RepID=UPI00261100BF|nr:VCBS repeat-containing protein [uncultured Tateyamaria sp.]
MPTWAPRLPLRQWRSHARGALPAVCLWLASMGALSTGAQAQDACTPGDGRVLAQACFLADPPPARRYGHDILGNTREWANLTLDWGPRADAAYTGGAPSLVLRLEAGIFEDVAPRVIQLDDDPLPEVLVANSERGKGARLLILDVNPDGIRSITSPFIGQQNRWYAPVGAADLDGDGVVEVMWIDRPHLAKVLRVAQVRGDSLVEVAALDGLTNHRIGEDDIAGGIRMCNGTPEMILSTGNWSDLVAITWDGDSFTRTYIGQDTRRPAFARAMACAE